MWGMDKRYRLNHPERNISKWDLVLLLHAHGRPTVCVLRTSFHSSKGCSNPLDGFYNQNQMEKPSMGLALLFNPPHPVYIP